MKLTTHQQIKKYVIDTIRSGNKSRIQKVMLHYVSWLKENAEEKKEDLIEVTKRIFNV